MTESSVVADEFEKTSNNLRVNLEIDDQLTWGELIRFVELGQQAGISPGQPVGLVYDENGDEMRVTGLFLYLAPDDLPTRRDQA